MKFSRKILVSSIVIAMLAAAGCSSTKKHAQESTSSESLTTQTPEVSLSESAVYFDFDKYNIREDQRNNADMIARLAKELFSTKASSSLRIEGNCDERGSAEYNMALGTRRADSLKSYLKAHGVDASRLTTMSYGLEKASHHANSEAVWQHDRRDDIAVLNAR